MPNKTTFLPIRTWLLVLVLLATLPAMGIIAANGYNNRQHALDDSREQAVRLAASLRTMQEGIADQARMLLTTLAHMNVVEHFDEQACDALFSRLLQSHKELTNILIADASGKVVASGLPPFKGVNVSDRKYFRDALGSGGFSVGEFNIGRTSKLPILVFALPLFNTEGRADRIVAISFSLHNYEKFLSGYELPSGARVTFFDYAGVRMLTYPPSPSFPLGEKLFGYVLTSVFNARDDAGQFEEKRADGTDGLFAYARLRLEPGANVYMGLVIVFSTWESLSEANAQLLQSLLVAVACLIAASAVALLLGEKTLLRGLNALMDASYKLGQGDLQARAPENEGALEVRRLGQAFNAMAGSLQSGRDQLEQNARELRKMRNLLNNVLESMPSAIIGLDREPQRDALEPRRRGASRF